MRKLDHLIRLGKSLESVPFPPDLDTFAHKNQHYEIPLDFCQLKSPESLVSNTDWMIVGWCLSAIEILHWSNDKIVEPIKNNWIFSTEETISFLKLKK